MNALCVFDDPIINSRFHEMLERNDGSDVHGLLESVPDRVSAAIERGREGARVWMETRAVFPDGGFVAWSERAVLDSFLTLAENQISMISHISRQAPSKEVRQYFDDMVEGHRNVAQDLRSALKKLDENGPREIVLPRPPGKRSVQEEEPSGDLRGQLEKAVSRAAKGGAGVRRILLSHGALRHLRDQGCFAQGEFTFAGHPVIIDLGWDEPAFAIQTYELVPLEEIVHHPLSAEP